MEGDWVWVEGNGNEEWVDLGGSGVSRIHQSEKTKKECSDCHLAQPRTGFSKHQWTKQNRRCKVCTQERNPSSPTLAPAPLGASAGGQGILLQEVHMLDDFNDKNAIIQFGHTKFEQAAVAKAIVAKKSAKISSVKIQAGKQRMNAKRVFGFKNPCPGNRGK